MRRKATDALGLGVRHETLDAPEARRETRDVRRVSSLSSCNLVSRLTSHAPTPWPKVRLGDVGKVVTGLTPPTKHSEYFGVDYLFVTPSDLEFDSRFINKTERGISKIGHVAFQSRFVPPMTTMYTCIGSTIGKIGLSHDCVLTNQQINSIVPHKDNDGMFIFYMMRYLTKNIRMRDAGCVVPIINKGDFESFQIPLPPLPVQRQIADILSAYDDLIENNRRRIAILEETARLAYRKWFGGMEQGRTATLGDVLETIESGSRPRGGAVNDGVPSIGAEKIESIGVYDYSSEKFVSREYYDKMRRGKIRSGDVLLYKDGAYTGKVSMALNGFPHAEAAVNEHVFILRTRNLHAQCFLYCFLRQQEIYDKINTIASAKACQPGLNQSDVLNLEIEVPTDDEIGRFENRVIPLFDEIVNFAKQNAALVTARDMLLPRLMKGDLMRLDMSDTDTTRCESRVQIPPFPNRGCVSDFGGAL